MTLDYKVPPYTQYPNLRFYAAVTFFFFFFAFHFFWKKFVPPPHFSAPSYATDYTPVQGVTVRCTVATF